MLLCSGDEVSVATKAHELELELGWSWIMIEQIEQSAVVEQMQGWLFVRPFLSSEGLHAFAEQVSDYTQSHFNISTSPDSVDLAYSVALHDAVMLFAHAATNVMLGGGDLQNGTAVTEAMRSTKFEGVGGTVVLDEDGDRVESYEVMSIVVGADTDKIRSVLICVYNRSITEQTTWEPDEWVPEAVVWPGNSTTVPIDSGESQF